MQLADQRVRAHFGEAHLQESRLANRACAQGFLRQGEAATAIQRHRRIAVVEASRRRTEGDRDVAAVRTGGAAARIKAHTNLRVNKVIRSTGIGQIHFVIIDATGFDIVPRTEQPQGEPTRTRRRDHERIQTRRAEHATASQAHRHQREVISAGTAEGDLRRMQINRTRGHGITAARIIEGVAQSAAGTAGRVRHSVELQAEQIGSGDAALTRDRQLVHHRLRRARGEIVQPQLIVGRRAGLNAAARAVEAHDILGTVIGQSERSGMTRTTRRYRVTASEVVGRCGDAGVAAAIGRCRCSRQSSTRAIARTARDKTHALSG